MNIILSNTDSAPIYEQITRQLRAKIVSGELAAGQALPSHAAARKGACASALSRQSARMKNSNARG